jgi:hypothetical protein
MNERIKQLANKAGITVVEHPFDDATQSWNDSMAKFAELIVAECMQQVEEQYKPVMEDDVMNKEPHWDGYIQCGVDSYVAIREHFFGEEE